MAAKKRTKGSTGKRYSPEEKKEILEFIESEGRGGLTKAKEKWGVSYIAIQRWKKETGKRGRPRKVAGKVVKAGNGKIKGLKGILTLVRRLEEKLSKLV